MSPTVSHLAILGAGPAGLEAALAAAERGLPFTVYEAAEGVAGNVRDWAHVRLFSPWHMDVSPRVRARLAAVGRRPPDGSGCPTGGELVEEVLEPLAELPEIAPHLRLGTRVVAVGREGLVKSDEIGTAVRAGRSFRLLLEEVGGGERVEHAAAVLDCTGSYAVANSLGDGGIPAPGERDLDPEIRRSLPDFVREGAAWAGKTTVLAGSGHSAQTAVRDLAVLAAGNPGMRVVWVLRRTDPTLGRIEDDPLPERARLAAAAGALAAGSSPAVEARRGAVVEGLAREGGRVRVVLRLAGGREEVVVDRVLSLTGRVGDHRLYRQLQVHECYATSGPMKLASALLGELGADCLAAPAPDRDTLKNPEPGFFILGSKSYGRNATYLMRTGWQQVSDALDLLRASSGVAARG